MTDRVVAAARHCHPVIWEEVARDGAQADTLMTAEQRVILAREQGRLFGDHGPDHLIFAAGFPSVAHEEFEIVRQLAHQVDECSLATHGRATREDVDLGIRALEGAAFGRVTFFLPISREMAGALLHTSEHEALAQGLEVARYAMDQTSDLPVDIALADASRADPRWVAEAAQAFADEGIGIVKICDSMGFFLPRNSREFFGALFAGIDDHVTIGVHLHNDLGLALASNLEALEQGAYVLASSWRGIGERSGLAATEQLVFVLATQIALEHERRGEPGLWLTPPNLHHLLPLARLVSDWLGVALESPDPIVGTGVNRWATGTPFLDAEVFRCFDAEELLGIEPRLVLTHLANRRLVVAVAHDLGIELDAGEAHRAMEWVKSRAYGTARAEISRQELAEFLEGKGSRLDDET